MKRFYYQKSILFILLNILVSQNVFAKTCAEVYEENLKWDYLKSGFMGAGEVLISAAASPTIVGLVVPVLFIEDELRIYKLIGTNTWTHPQNRKRVIRLLKAASILNGMKESDKSSKESKSANKKINSFYNKYILASWPHAQIEYEEVIDRLAFVNDHGVEAGLCHGLVSKKVLANQVFKDGMLSIDVQIKEYKSRVAEAERVLKEEKESADENQDSIATQSQDDTFQSLITD
jgi:hypothetical protein